MVMAAGGPNDGEVALQYVLKVVLGQPQDGPLTKNLKRGRISKLFDILLFNHTDQDSLTFLD